MELVNCKIRGNSYDSLYTGSKCRAISTLELRGWDSYGSGRVLHHLDHLEALVVESVPGVDVPGNASLGIQAVGLPPRVACISGIPRHGLGARAHGGVGAAEPVGARGGLEDGLRDEHLEGTRF